MKMPDKERYPMVIVAGHITVQPHQRDAYLAGGVSVVDKLAGYDVADLRSLFEAGTS